VPAELVEIPFDEAPHVNAFELKRFTVKNVFSGTGSIIATKDPYAPLRRDRLLEVEVFASGRRGKTGFRYNLEL
jgi:hypothetical protein